MPHGEDNSTLSAVVPKEYKSYMKVRADRLGWSTSQVVNALIEKWLSDGAPALSPLDKNPPAFKQGK